MLAPNQTLLLHDYFTRSRDLWLLCEKYDCDHDQMLAIIGAITQYLPGKGLDYQAIPNQDPIACDHLVLHCQRSIGQLDALYDRLISLFDSSSSHELQINKRTTVNIPPDWAKPSFSDGQLHWDTSKGSEKIETTTLENKQRFRILESAMKCLERGLKMQITLTQRKEKLSKQQKPATQQEPPKQARQQASSSHREEQPDNPYNGLSGYTGLTGYNLQSSPLAPRGDSRSTEISPNSPVATCFQPVIPQANVEASSSNVTTTNTLSQQELPRASGSPAWSYSTTRAAQPQEASSKHHKNDNNLTQEELREEAPVTTDLSVPSAPPRETSPPGPEQSTIPKIPHPQYTPRESDSDWQTFIPLGMGNGLEDGPMEEFIYPVFAKPLGENEKVHYFPPFAEASPEDAAEIDAYLKSLPAEITAENNIGSYFNDYLLAPILRTTQSEAEHTIHHRRLKRTAARQQFERASAESYEHTTQLQLATANALDNKERLYHQRE